MWTWQLSVTPILAQCTLHDCPCQLPPQVHVLMLYCITTPKTCTSSYACRLLQNLVHWTHHSSPSSKFISFIHPPPYWLEILMINIIMIDYLFLEYCLYLWICILVEWKCKTSLLWIFLEGRIYWEADTGHRIIHKHNRVSFAALVLFFYARDVT